MDAETLLKEYHRRIGEIFLAPGQSPFRIAKQLWALHAEMEGKISRLPTPAVPDAKNAPVS